MASRTREEERHQGRRIGKKLHHGRSNALMIGKPTGCLNVPGHRQAGTFRARVKFFTELTPERPYDARFEFSIRDSSHLCHDRPGLRGYRPGGVRSTLN